MHRFTFSEDFRYRGYLLLMDNFFIPNEAEFRIIEEIAASDSDCSVVMMNLNKYFEEAGYPDGQPYSDWMKVLDVLIKQAGGKKLWQLSVLGQPIGNQDLDEIIAVWYPSHQAFLSITQQPASEENFRLRNICVKYAVLHRCPGDVIASS